MKAEQFVILAFDIMTSKFVSAAELMSRVLGAENYPFAVIDHPISSASELDLAPTKSNRPSKQGFLF